MDKFVKGKQASQILGVHQRTLMSWDKKGLIETKRTPSNQRLYNVGKYMNEHSYENNICNNLDELDTQTNLKICYVRVSSKSQENDLQRQKEVMYKKYPTYLLIEDIGSGLNLNKRGIKKIIHLAIQGKVKELVVAYKDRLTRFGYELIEELIIKYSKGKIIILDEQDKMEPQEELVKDVMAIMNVYVAKMNGLRKYKKLSV